MKKKLMVILAIVLCVTFAFTLVACGDKDGDENNVGNDGNVGNVGGGGVVSATAYEGGGTISAAVTITADDLDDPENEEYFVSGTTQAISGATATDVMAYRNKLVLDSWILVDTGSGAAASSSSGYVYYKGDTVISIIYAGNVLTITTANYKAGTVTNVLQQDDDDDDDGDVAEYTQIPANLKLVYTDLGGSVCSFYHVGNDWYFTETIYSDTSYAYWKYDVATSRWTCYAYQSGDVAWTPTEYVATTANLDNHISGKWGDLLMTADAKFLAGTSGEATIAGIPCNTYTYTDEDTSVNFIAIAKASGLCMKSTVEFRGSLISEFEVTAFETSGVTMSATGVLPVAIDAKVAWPTAKINTDFGANVLPAYTGNATMINYNATELFGYDIISINVKGVTREAFDAYVALYEAAGYTASDDTFKKTTSATTYMVEINYYSDGEDDYGSFTLEAKKPISKKKT